MDDLAGGPGELDHSLGQLVHIAIQIPMIEARQHALGDQRIERLAVHHLSVATQRSFHRHVQHVIMAVAVGIVALAVETRVFLRTEGLVVQAVRGDEAVTAGQAHGSPP